MINRKERVYRKFEERRNSWKQLHSLEEGQRNFGEGLRVVAPQPVVPEQSSLLDSELHKPLEVSATTTSHIKTNHCSN